MSWEAVVTAWQAGCESLLTGRLVPQLVAAEENRTSCQPSGRQPTFALHVAVQLLRIYIWSFICADWLFAGAWTWALICLYVNGKIVGRRLGWLTPTSYITRTRATTAVIGERKVIPPTQMCVPGKRFSVGFTASAFPSNGQSWE